MYSEVPQSQPNNARIIWKNGALFGVGLAIVECSICSFPIVGLAIFIPVVLWIAGFFLAGMFGARQSGKVGVGTLTGLVTGLFFGVLAYSYSLFTTLVLNPEFINDGMKQAFQQNPEVQQNPGITLEQAQAIGIGSIVFALLFFFLLIVALGVGISALGGLLGRGQKRYGVETPVHFTPQSDNRTDY